MEPKKLTESNKITEPWKLGEKCENKGNAIKRKHKLERKFCSCETEMQIKREIDQTNQEQKLNQSSGQRS